MRKRIEIRNGYASEKDKPKKKKRRFTNRNEIGREKNKQIASLTKITFTRNS